MAFSIRYTPAQQQPCRSYLAVGVRDGSVTAPAT
jgi:hypothetical protein